MANEDIFLKSRIKFLLEAERPIRCVVIVVGKRRIRTIRWEGRDNPIRELASGKDQSGWLECDWMVGESGIYVAHCVEKNAQSLLSKHR